MFSSLFGLPPAHDAAEGEGKELDPNAARIAASGAEAGESSGQSQPVGLLNLWNVAAAVTSSVKARADELVKSVAETDWKNELATFGAEVKEDTKTITHKAQEVVVHLPEVVEQIPEQASKVHMPADVGLKLEEVGSSLSSFGKVLLAGTKEFIDTLKDGVDSEIATAAKEAKRAARAGNKAGSASAAKLAASTSTKYSRFESEVAAMQRDSSTYCDEPEDAEDYARWRASFDLEAKKSEVAKITGENAFMAELQSRIVPIIVEYDDFWTRYFYRHSKLAAKEETRQALAARAKGLTTQADEDDLPGWGDEDDGKDKVQGSAPAPAASSGGAASGATEAATATPTPAPPPPPPPARTPSGPLSPTQHTVSSKPAAADDSPAASTPEPSAEPAPAAASAPGSAGPATPDEPAAALDAGAPEWCMVSERAASTGSSGSPSAVHVEVPGEHPALAVASTPMHAEEEEEEAAAVEEEEVEVASSPRAAGAGAAADADGAAAAASAPAGADELDADEGAAAAAADEAPASPSAPAAGSDSEALPASPPARPAGKDKDKDKGGKAGARAGGGEGEEEDWGSWD